MGERTAISWTHHTFNPWWGCAEVSPACDHCYARAWAKRTGFSDLWGTDANRRFFSDAHWREPLKWNRKADEAGERRRVFCASMADVFDNHPDVADARTRLWGLIGATPNLDWLLLTKRIGNVPRMTPPNWAGPLPVNVWLGITVVNQEEADRDIPKLLATPAAIRFLSCEPLIGDIDVSSWLWGRNPPCDTCPRDLDCECGFNTRRENGQPSIDWVITGGESGGDARPTHPDWIRSLRDQCIAAGVAFHHKQWGEWSPTGGVNERTIDVGEGLNRYRMVRLGKKAAGRMLDGRIWDEFPRSAE